MYNTQVKFNLEIMFLTQQAMELAVMFIHIL